MQFDKPLIHFTLKEPWFSKIGNYKKEEYREMKEYWDRRFTGDGRIKLKGKIYEPHEVYVCFSRDYKKNTARKVFEIKNVSTGTGNPLWGAEEGVKYHTITVGHRLK